MALHDITLSYADLSVVFRYWKGADLPRSRKIFVNESNYSANGNLIKSGTNFELPYLWTIVTDLYQTEYDKITAIWEILDYSRRNDRALTVVTGNQSANTLSANSHPFQNGDVITLSTSHTLPSPLTTGRDYYVVERASNTFKVALTFGGAAIDLTSNGSGTNAAKTQLFVRVDDESEEIFERGVTSLTKTRTSVTGTAVREINGGAYYYARFLADWVAPAEFGKVYTSTRYSPVLCGEGRIAVRAASMVLQDTGVKI
jgi:hypothetical protein